MRETDEIGNQKEEGLTQPNRSEWWFHLAFSADGAQVTFLQLTPAKAQGQNNLHSIYLQLRRLKLLKNNANSQQRKKHRGSNGTPALEPEDHRVFVIRIQFVFLKIQVMRASVFCFSRSLPLWLRQSSSTEPQLQLLEFIDFKWAQRQRFERSMAGCC